MRSSRLPAVLCMLPSFVALSALPVSASARSTPSIPFATPGLASADAASEAKALTKLDDYWNKDARPTVKNLTIKIIPEDLTRVAAFKTGAIDWIDAVPLSMIEEFRKIPGVKTLTVVTGNNLYLAFPEHLPSTPFISVRRSANSRAYAPGDVRTTMSNPRSAGSTSCRMISRRRRLRRFRSTADRPWRGTMMPTLGKPRGEAHARIEKCRVRTTFPSCWMRRMSAPRLMRCAREKRRRVLRGGVLGRKLHGEALPALLTTTT